MWYQAKPRFKLCSRDCENLVFAADFLGMSQSDRCDQNLAAKLSVSHPCQQWTEYAKSLSPEMQEGYGSHIPQPVLCLGLIVYALVKVGKGPCTHG